MEDTTHQLNELFASPTAELRPEVLGELQSVLRLHSISPQELYFKWESYSIKMGAEETKLDLKTARDFKKDLQELLERESRGKAYARNEKRTVGATPRAGVSNGDVFGMLDGLVPNAPRLTSINGTNGSTAKRKSTFETPAAKASKTHTTGSPGETKASNPPGTVNVTQTTSFADRANAGQIVETLNDHVELPDGPAFPPAEARIKLKANTDMGKFSHKTMAMKLSEASEVLDDRIDEFLSLIQAEHNLEDSAFGNPASQSTSEIVAVGRIASDTGEGRLNAASLVLETSRRTGAGLRVPLRIDALQSYSFFPGKIVALRGANASGDFFAATEILDPPLLPPAASYPADLDACNARLLPSPSDDDAATPSAHPLTILVAAGPYTTDADLDFSPLHTLLETAKTLAADALILLGPFLDVEHPSVRTGAFSLPASSPVPPDKATLADVFKHHVSAPLVQLAQALPSISIIMAPSVRDAAARHVAWPQDRLTRKELGLPPQAKTVTNPAMLSLNETVLGVSSLDVLDAVRASEAAGGGKRSGDFLARLCKEVVGQRHFFPVFPPPGRRRDEKAAGKGEGREEAEEEEEMGFAPVGAMLDVSYAKLGEWLNVRPDVLVCPSVLTPFAKVVDSVLVVNPGTLSKRKGPGTYARVTVLPASVTDDERAAGSLLEHKLFERARVDIVRI